MEQAHLLHYKTENGEWKAIPYGILDMYTAYVAYCAKNGTTPVDENIYYETIGSLATKVAELDDLLGELGNANELANLLNALKQQALPTSAGGTGISAAKFADLVTEIVSVGNLINNNTLSEAINAAAESKFDANKIGVGTDDPATTLPSDTPITIYFQFED